MNQQLDQLLEMKGSEQEARIQQLLKDETFQRQAFFNLYLQQVRRAQISLTFQAFLGSVLCRFFVS